MSNKARLREMNAVELAHTLSYAIGQRILAQSYSQLWMAEATVAVAMADAEMHLSKARTHIKRIDELNEYIADAEAEVARRKNLSFTRKSGRVTSEPC